MNEEEADPLTTTHAEWICARACANGSRCLQRVMTPDAAYVVHDDDSPIIPPGGNRHTE